MCKGKVRNQMKIEMDRLPLANLPTRIDMLKARPAGNGTQLFIKRDDETGIELSGNKVRKLEYSLAEALAQGCDTIITAGGVQSNHCRATAAACVRLGLECVLILASDEKQPLDGNYLMDELFGATILFIPAETFATQLAEVMRDVQEELKAESRMPYLIPVGASNGIGTFGYFHAFEEILEQEKELGISFDTIVCAVGSGGTYAGLALANKVRKADKKIIGVNISANREHFEQRVLGLSRQFMEYYGDFSFGLEDIHILDGYVGRGYALSSEGELSFISQFARTEGIILDPVYTGKAMGGLMQELKERSPFFAGSKKILFIHTGGIFGLFPKRHQF